MVFHDARLSFQHWQSCASCHPDARADGLNWDLLNDGLGNPKNTRSMLLVHQGGPAMSLGVRASAEAAVRAGFLRSLFAAVPEEDAAAVDAYLKSLAPVPSPHLIDGRLSPAAERGKQLFFDPKVGCAACHPEPTYSDKKLHNVASQGKFDDPNDKFTTPRLVEVWRTAPYMHDGQYLTIKELLVEGKHGLNADEAARVVRCRDRRSGGVRAVAVKEEGSGQWVPTFSSRDGATIAQRFIAGEAGIPCAKSVPEGRLNGGASFSVVPTGLSEKKSVFSPPSSKLLGYCRTVPTGRKCG